MFRRFRGALSRLVGKAAPVPAPVPARDDAPAPDPIAEALAAERDDSLLAAISTLLADSGASIAILAPTGSTFGRKVRSRYPSAQVTVVKKRFPAAHVRLTAPGPFDLVVDAKGPAGRRSRFLNAFYQVTPGGVMLIADAAAELADPPATELGPLLRHAENLRDQSYPGGKRGVATAVLDAHGLGRAISGVAVTGQHLIAHRSEVPVLAKLREPEMNEYLAARPGGQDRLLEQIAAEPFDSACEFTENVPERRENFCERYETIDLSLRLYHDVVMTPGQVLSTDRVITPDSYRHNQYARLRNRYTVEVAPRFATLRHGADDLPYLEGTYFHLDNEVRGHFGHLMTEQLSRFWGWSRARERYPDIKAVVAINKGHELRSWETDVFAAGGIAAEDVVFLRSPARVERMVSATPMLSNPDYVHPAIKQTWREVGDRLASGAAVVTGPRRFFCSRRLAKRSCHNTEDVEAIFAENGFAIIYPEDYSLGEQVQLFRAAEVIGGFVGSGLFTLCYVMDPIRVISVGSTAYTARNEYLIASVLGHRMDSVVCVPDDPTFYQSPFTFDSVTEGGYLRGLLASL